MRAAGGATTTACSPPTPRASWPRSPAPRGSGRSRPWRRSARPRGRSLALIRAGTRSLRAELEHLLLLATVYGPAPVEAALAACLARAIVGSEHVERWLQVTHAGPVAPPPLALGDPRLTAPPVRPNLARYDTLLLDADGAASPTEEADGPADA